MIVEKITHGWYTHGAMKKIALFLILVLLLAAAGCGRRAETAPTDNTAAPDSAAETAEDPYAGMLEVPNGWGGTMWVREAQNVPRFALEAEKFSVTDGIVSYDGDEITLRRGLDVSAYQGEIDWSAVAADGMEFAILRCGYRGSTEGGLYEDETFRANYDGARAAGLAVGAYFYSQAVNAEEGAEEARFVLEVLEGCELQLPVWFDWEEMSGEVRTAGLAGRVVTDAALAFCEELTEAGVDCGVYMYLNLAYNVYDLDRLAELPLWLGDPGSKPELIYDHAIWQYSTEGTVSGVPVPVDLDVLYEWTD